mgnify:FL=1
MSRPGEPVHACHAYELPELCGLTPCGACGAGNAMSMSCTVFSVILAQIPGFFTNSVTPKFSDDKVVEKPF